VSLEDWAVVTRDSSWARLDDLARVATKVTLLPGDTRTIDLTLMALPDKR